MLEHYQAAAGEERSEALQLFGSGGSRIGESADRLLAAHADLRRALGLIADARERLEEAKTAFEAIEGKEGKILADLAAADEKREAYAAQI